MNIKITITSVKSGKNKNWLTFSAFIDSLSKNTLYSFDFCGTEIIHSLSLRQKAIDELCSKLCSDFGYAPYDVNKCKKICGKGKEYFIKP